MSRINQNQEVNPYWAKSRRHTGDYDPNALLDSTPYSANTVFLVLCLLLPVVRLYVTENVFRFILGFLNQYTQLSQQQLAICSGTCTKTVRAGIADFQGNQLPDRVRTRNKGAGRPKAEDKDPELEDSIMEMIKSHLYGHCTKLSDYCSLSLRKISSGLSGIKKKLSSGGVKNFLARHGIKRRRNKKVMCGALKHLSNDRKKIYDEQFSYINETLSAAQKDESMLLLSIDCKKKETLGRFAGTGMPYTECNQQIECEDHDFAKQLNPMEINGFQELFEYEGGKAIPYGIYDITQNRGYVNIGISHDTAAFAVQSIETFLPKIKNTHPNYNRIVLLCDGGGSNSARSRLFKYELAMLSDRVEMPIEVIHYPPYKSKYNKIERHLFAPISVNFGYHILDSLKTIHHCIVNTTTKTGLIVDASVDLYYYKTGIKIDDKMLEAVQYEYTGPTKDSQHWSYKISGTVDKRGKNEKTDRVYITKVEKLKQILEEEANLEKKQKKGIQKTA